MKRIISGIISASLILLLTACGKDGSSVPAASTGASPVPGTTSGDTQASQPDVSPPAAEASTTANGQETPDSAAQPSSSEEKSTDSAPQPASSEEKSTDSAPQPASSEEKSTDNAPQPASSEAESTDKPRLVEERFYYWEENESMVITVGIFDDGGWSLE